MSSYINILFAIALVLSSCAEEQKEPPADLIPENQFVELLVDMNLIEAVRSMTMTKEKSSKVPTEEFYNHIWKEKGITEEEFLRSFAFYRKDVEKMSELYSQASDILKRKEDDINALKKRDKNTPNSGVVGGQSK